MTLSPKSPASLPSPLPASSLEEASSSKMRALQPLIATLLSTPSEWEWRRSPLPALTPPSEILQNPSIGKGWKSCVQMPSLIHVELLAKGEIPDPFIGYNEKDVQWVGEEDWLYRTTFDTPKEDMEYVDLIFEGLDTFASVFVNGEEILKTDNMFTPYRVDVKPVLKPKGERNDLVIVFPSAFITGRVLEEKKLGKGKHNALYNGDPSRLFVRKAGYNYGWDWGPTLMTAGPWKPVCLEAYDIRLEDFWPRAIVDQDLSASLEIATLTTTQSSNDNIFVNASVKDPKGQVIRKRSIPLSRSSNESIGWTFEEGEIDLWWSIGFGAQPLYNVTVELVTSNGKVIDSGSHTVGFRRVRIVKEELFNTTGHSFYFELNNVPVFAGGSNWIPIDSFATRGTKKRYEDWFDLVVKGNQNMIRVWGGGYYEDDYFYRLADERGILVWQDFMFACGQYPVDEAFAANVKIEAETNVRRIRHHPSIVIFAGNNEDYQLAEDGGLGWDPADTDGDWLNTTFPGRYIYERVLPELVGRLSDVPYHPGSPWGVTSTRTVLEGDLHIWEVWHGSQQPYQKYDELAGRFVSEFGMQGLPDIRTVDYFLDGDVSERHPQSRLITAHNKATGFERRLTQYLVENIRFDWDLESYIYATQLVQAEAVSAAYRYWRRNFSGPGKYYTGGALVWQMNDVWPCTSWSIVDYFLRPKPSYYLVKRSLKTIAAGMKRYTTVDYPDPHSAAKSIEHDWVEYWASNSGMKTAEVTVVLQRWSLKTGERLSEKIGTTTLNANGVTELGRIDVGEKSLDTVVSLRIEDKQTKNVLSRYVAFPEPMKYLVFASKQEVDLQVKVDVTHGTIRAVAARPVKGLVFYFDHDVQLDDNCLDLTPGDEQTIKVAGLTEKVKVTWRYLGDRD